MSLFDTFMYRIRYCIILVMETQQTSRSRQPNATDPGADRQGDPTPGVSKKRAATQARLLAAASQVFAERGFGRATVEDVCERAGFSRGAFYSNFDSLDGLFFALYSSWSSELIAAVRQAVDLAPSELSLRELIDQVISVLPVNRRIHLLNLEFAAHALRHPEVGIALAGSRRRLREALMPVLRIGLIACDPAFDDARLDELARAVIAVQDGMFLQELLEPADRTLPALRRRLLTTVLDATE